VLVLSDSDLGGIPLLRQSTDWDCGPTALAQLMIVVGTNPSVKTVEQAKELARHITSQIKPSPETGTSHDQIIGYLRSIGQAFAVYERVPIHIVGAPCLVNYQWSGDGHYGVVIEVDEVKSRIRIINPGNGKIDRYSISEFNKRWFSRRYGARWAVKIWRVYDHQNPHHQLSFFEKRNSAASEIHGLCWAEWKRKEFRL